MKHEKLSLESVKKSTDNIGGWVAGLGKYVEEIVPCLKLRFKLSPSGVNILVKLYKDGSFAMSCNGTMTFSEQTWKELNESIEKHKEEASKL